MFDDTQRNFRLRWAASLKVGGMGALCTLLDLPHSDISILQAGNPELNRALANIAGPNGDIFIKIIEARKRKH
jgi:hypothetical protein